MAEVLGIRHGDIEIKDIQRWPDVGIFRGNVSVMIHRSDFSSEEDPWFDKATINVCLKGGDELTYADIEAALKAQAILTLRRAIEALE